jgi:flagellar M-ring protein FliF
MIGKLSPRGWAVLGISAAGAVLFLYLMVHLVSQPSYSTIETGIDPANTAKMTAVLDQQGIGYQLQNNGTALAVDTAKTAQARIALASAGVSSNSQPDFSLFNNQSLGASNFQEQVTYQRALQGQLAETIDKVQGVSDAQVTLVLPDASQQLFSDNQSNSSAAVLITDNGALDAGSVRGVAQLVASSVPGLSASKVTITDSTGALLWPTAGGAAAGADGAAADQQSANANYNQQADAQLNALVTRMVGPGKGQVAVNAQVNANQSTQDALTYGKATPTQTQTQTETLTGNGSATGGVAGTVGTGTATTNGGTSNYKSTTANTTFGVDKTVTHTVLAAGALQSQSVSLVLDSSIPAAEATQVETAVKSAAGVQTPRDTITLSQVKFAPASTTTAAGPASNMMQYAEYAIVGFGALIFLFIITRVLRRREQETLAGEPTWLRELQLPRRLVELEQETRTTPVEKVKVHENPTRAKVEDLVKREPERVAQQVRAWMQED